MVTTKVGLVVELEQNAWGLGILCLKSDVFIVILMDKKKWCGVVWYDMVGCVVDW